MKKAFLIAAGLIGLSGSVQAAIFTIYSDKGISGTDLFNWPNPPNGSVFQTTVTVPSAPEGQYSMLSQPVSGGFNGWGVFYRSGVNLSAYDASHNGVLRFWLYSTTDDLTLSLEHTGGVSTGNNQIDCNNGRKDCFDFKADPDNPDPDDLSHHLNEWVLIQLPMNDCLVPGTKDQLINCHLDDLYSPFEITANTSGNFYIDDVRYVDNMPAAYTTGDSPDAFTVQVKNISDQQPASAMTWNNGISPTGWARSNQYIELTVDAAGSPASINWGVQIYTDNSNASANPRFTRPAGINPGDPGSNPAGLVNTQEKGLRIPLAWSAKAATQTAAAAAPTAAEPNNNADTNSFQWLYMKDAGTPTITSEGTTAFQNGSLDSFVVVKDNAGIHYGQRPTDFGAEDPPNYIYLEANFGSAVSQRTYQTSRLIVEFYYQ